MNLGAMQVMFKMRDHKGAYIQVKAVDDYRFLNSSYVPVLRQLESKDLTALWEIDMDGKVNGAVETCFGSFYRYNPSINMDEIGNVAVVHFNRNMKPWLDTAMNQFRPIWTKYVDSENDFVEACNFGLQVKM
ncbi:unnamed protein product [Ilex paraguariensis]|uniref:Hexosyltransferase n=1 Tax=Ilex paraguariensis TaxID=185542 RepID=A0ABC8S722_9AQUA